MTVDVEEWFQVENLRSAVSRDKWETYRSTVAANIDIVLDLFENENVIGTFFILGWVAERNPDMVKKIFDHGHEIASHGYGHSITDALKDDQLYEDIKKSKQILENIIRSPIIGYRAPNFSVNDEVIDILKDLSFSYDSSYNPFQLHNRYGNFNKYKIQKKNIFNVGNGIFEIPIGSLKMGKMHLPIGGGAYFRILPYFLFKNLALFKGKYDNLYNFYIHPWEFEPGQPRVNGISLNYRLRHYTGLKKTVWRLERLINDFHKKEFIFMTMRDYLEKETKSQKRIGLKAIGRK